MKDRIKRAAAASSNNSTAAKQQNNFINSQNNKKMKNLSLATPDNNTVGVTVEYIKLTGESVINFFQTDRSEFQERFEMLNAISNSDTELDSWFKRLVFVHESILDIDQDYFHATILIITAHAISKKTLEDYPNEPVGFHILIYEGSFQIKVLGMNYKVWLEIIEHHKNQHPFQGNRLRA